MVLRVLHIGNCVFYNIGPSTHPPPSPTRARACTRTRAHFASSFPQHPEQRAPNEPRTSPENEPRKRVPKTSARKRAPKKNPENEPRTKSPERTANEPRKRTPKTSPEKEPRKRTPKTSPENELRPEPRPEGTPKTSPENEPQKTNPPLPECQFPTPRMGDPPRTPPYSASVVVGERGGGAMGRVGGSMYETSFDVLDFCSKRWAVSYNKGTKCSV